MKNSTKFTLLATAALGIAAVSSPSKAFAEDLPNGTTVNNSTIVDPNLDKYIAASGATYVRGGFIASVPDGTTINGSKIVDQNLNRFITASGAVYIRDGDIVNDGKTTVRPTPPGAQDVSVVTPPALPPTPTPPAPPTPQDTEVKLAKPYPPQAGLRDSDMISPVQIVNTKPTTMTSGAQDDDKFPLRKLGTIETNRIAIKQLTPIKIPTTLSTPTAPATPIPAKKAVVTATKTTVAKNNKTATATPTKATVAAKASTVAAAKVEAITPSTFKGKALATLPATGSDDGIGVSLIGSLALGLGFAGFLASRRYTPRHNRKK